MIIYRLNLETTQTERLDFDNATLNSTFTLRVTVNDTVQIDTITVDISIVDLNDNNPVFENTTL